MKKIVYLVKTARPKQWTKNLIVFTAPIFSGSLMDSHNLAVTLLAFFSLCFLSGTVYIINDLADREKDAHHPRKKNRPIASGKLSPVEAALGGAAMFSLAAITGFLAGTGFVFFAAIYFLLQLGYTFYLKQFVILDVFAIAAGFLVRAVAGAAAVEVSLSPWLLICATLLALFLGFGKRRHELLLLENDASNHRQVLEEYSRELLDALLIIVSAATIVCYALYTFFSGTGSSPLMLASIPFVMYGLFRYLYLVYSKNLGGNPEEILISDIPTIVTVLLWVAVVAAAIYLS